MAITYVTNEAETYKRECGWLARRAGVTTLTGRVSLTIDLYPNRPQDWAKRARKDPDTWADSVQCIDLGNCEKVLSDALNGIAWNDDKQLHDIRLRRMEPDDKGARVEVTITPIVAVKIAPELGL
jgi:crossover junction endodeoxyribonuclease RusA